MAKVLILNPGGKKAKRKKNVSRKHKITRRKHLKAKKLKKAKKLHKRVEKAKAHNPKVKKNIKKGAIMAKHRKHKKAKKNPYRATKPISAGSKVKGKMWRSKKNPGGALSALSRFDTGHYRPMLDNVKKHKKSKKYGKSSWLRRNPAVGAIAKHIVTPFSLDGLYKVLGLSIGAFGTLAIQAAVPVQFLKKGVGSYIGNIVSAIALASATKAATKKEDMAKMVLYGGLSVVVIRAIAAVVAKAPATNAFAANIKESLTMAGLDDVGATEAELKAAIEEQVARELTGVGEGPELPYATSEGVGEAPGLPYATVGEMPELPYSTSEGVGETEEEEEEAVESVGGYQEEYQDR